MLRIRILDAFWPRRCSEFKFWTHFCLFLTYFGISCLGDAQTSNSGRILAQILETLCKSCSPGAQNSNSGHLRTQILDTLCKSCSLEAQNSNSGHLWAHPSSYSSSQQSINSTKFKRVDPQYDDFLGAAVTRRRRPQLF